MNQIVLIILAVMATAGRVIGLILISILTGWFLAYASIKSKFFENTYIILIEIFESVPVITFFPVVLIIFIDRVGGPLGVEMAADFLVFTAVVWNIWMGEYQAFKTVPREMVEVVENSKYKLFGKLRTLYIPFSIPRIAANLFPSVSDGFFYITVSEVFEVGIHTYQTFGIGSVLDTFVADGNTFLIEMSLLILGIIIVAIILILREFSKYAVSRYTLDNDAPVLKRGRINLRETARVFAVISKNPFSRLSRYYKYRENESHEETYEKKVKKQKYLKYIYAAAGIFLLILILYAAVSTIISVKYNEWMYLFSKTKMLLTGLGFDYLRVLTILLVSMAIAIFLGYYLAVNKHAELVGIPLIQILSAYPAPIYFPFIFIATEPFMFSVFGGTANELYVLFLGFVSTFYYVFYSFWMGVKAMPAEYWEITRNLKLGYFKKMRKVIIPSTFPYMISGISSTINSAWGGLMIGEYWPHIYGTHSLYVHEGLMKTIDVATGTGNIALAAWGSFIFGIIVAIYSVVFTRKMMDLAQKKYVAEEGVYAA
ncbi:MULTISPECIES: ABC transporter permease subunit [Acidiplasma]|jgi:NitT/TauT family transport system permease protein|uniref:Sugar ABC transporter permease n=1 Tax=Acidiplasma cupricumulans TaxID=312540 RepID=A0A0Q0VNP8_9ARCH|nr:MULTISPECIES: ABC transporter permease subunit [Acidiplasma]KJE48835.1 sugar ABC transporter permease [Acidiplasma sp. MBA-1]KQB35141.1 sugar ABC transporter permease [Acidiplasma cupricumulans]WMT54231.1 MAG: ABC transporter permease subunit [Acidiplasma sp.]